MADRVKRKYFEHFRKMDGLPPIDPDRFVGDFYAAHSPTNVKNLCLSLLVVAVFGLTLYGFAHS